MDQVQDQKTLTGAALILGICLITSTVIGAYVFYQVRSFDNALSVTGSAKQAVKSDSVKWITTFNRVVTVDNIKTGSAQLASDLDLVKKFYTASGYADKDLTISPVFMDEVYNQNGPKQYMLRQTVELRSADVDKVTALAKSTQSLVGSGVIFSTQSLEYYYSKLPELRVSLLAAALADAKARSGEIAKAGGKQVGALKLASSGVVQVLPPGSAEVSDYGNYDTSSIDKDVMVTVKASFYLK